MLNKFSSCCGVNRGDKPVGTSVSVTMDGVRAVQMQSPEEGRFITATRPKNKKDREKNRQKRKLKSTGGRKNVVSCVSW